MTTRDLTFTSAGVECAAWHLTAASDELSGEGGRPCVVMAHGFGGTRDTALLPFAEGLAAAGLDVLLFDYRGFGASAGSPRQRISFRRQRADYRAAISAARRIEGVDPERIVLWGTSYSGGHVIVVAASDPGVAAVVSMTPATDGAAALVTMARHVGPGRMARLVLNGLRDALRAATGRTPHMLTVVGPAGSDAVMASDYALEAYTALTGPTWRNEICARSALGVAFNRPVRFARRLRRPLLVQIGDVDSVAPPGAALTAAARAGAWAQTCRYPVDHFDVYAGRWQQQLLADQLEFLRRSLVTA